MRYLFIGPSLPDVCDLLDEPAVRVLPPIAAGDLLSLSLAEGDIVGIIDGYFHQRMAVRHKEIFMALAFGVRVLGASSIGALRAVELERYGMEGVGEIYADYRTGRIVGDDEVALLHGPAEAGYLAFSQPLVNIRATLAAAVDGAVIGEDEGDRLIAALAAMPYQRRGYSVLLESAEELGFQQGKVAALAAFCRDHAVDVKRRDALLLLDRLNATPDQAAPKPQLSRTRLLHNWEIAARVTPSRDGDHGLSSVALMYVCQLFAVDYPEFYRRLVFNIISQECARECENYQPNLPLSQAAVAHGRHRGFYPDHLDKQDFGFLAKWTTETERLTRTREELLYTFIVRSFRIGPIMIPRMAAIEALEKSSTFSKVDKIVRAAAHLESEVRAGNPGYGSSTLADERVTQWFARRWRVEPKDTELAAMDRGFGSLETFLEAAKPYYLLAKYNTAIVNFTVSNGTQEGTGLI